MKYKTVPITGDYILKIALGISISIFIFLLISQIRTGNKVSKFLGQISYEVYLTQFVAFDFLTNLDDKRKLGSTAFIAISLVLILVISTFSKYLSNKIISSMNKKV